jgi:hypothetical protein
MKITIEKGIKIPLKVRGHGKWQKLMHEMNEGDSVLLPFYTGKSFVSSMYCNGVQPATRTEIVDGIRMLRVWKMGVFDE